MIGSGLIAYVAPSRACHHSQVYPVEVDAEETTTAATGRERRRGPSLRRFSLLSTGSTMRRVKSYPRRRVINRTARSL